MQVIGKKQKQKKRQQKKEEGVGGQVFFVVLPSFYVCTHSKRIKEQQESDQYLLKKIFGVS